MVAHNYEQLLGFLSIYDTVRIKTSQKQPIEDVSVLGPASAKLNKINGEFRVN